MSTAPNPSTAQARVMVDELVRCGVAHAVLAPGSRSTALALALHDDPRLRLHVAIDERDAGFLAVGVGRATGRPAAVVTTSGSAVAHLHPAVIEADTGRVPVVLLTADRPPELQHTGANQTIDQRRLFGSAVRHDVELGVAGDRDGAVAHWRSVVCRLVAEAQGLSGPPGPVHANLAFREPTVPRADDGRSRAEPFTGALDGRADGAPWMAVRRGRPVADEATLERLADRLSRTRRGLIVAGQPAGLDPGERAAAGTALRELAGATGWPVVAEPGSPAREDPQAIGAAHHLLAHAGFREAHRPELVLRVGRTGLSRRLAALLHAGVPQVLVDPHGGWHDPERSVAELLVADVADTATRLADAVRVADRPADDGWLGEWTRAETVARRAIDARLEAADGGAEPRIARDVAAAVPEGGVLVAASSMPIRDLDLAAAPRAGRTVLANRGASGIDGLVATALGAAVASGAPIVALAGDLSALHGANGWLVDVDGGRPDLVLVVVDNDGGGIFHLLPQAAEPGFERVFGTPHGRDLADLARLHRLGYRVVGRAGEVAHAVGAALAAGGPQLVHVRTDRDAGAAARQALTDAVTTALDADAPPPGP